MGQTMFTENFQQIDPLTTHFKYITNLCIKTKIVTEKNTQQVNNVNVFMVDDMTESEDFMAYGYLRLTCATLIIHTNQNNCHKCAV